jgi:hypothetical protein
MPVAVERGQIHMISTANRGGLLGQEETATAAAAAAKKSSAVISVIIDEDDSSRNRKRQKRMLSYTGSSPKPQYQGSASLSLGDENSPPGGDKRRTLMVSPSKDLYGGLSISTFFREKFQCISGIE